MSYVFGNVSDQLDRATVMLRASRQNLETGHDKLKTLQRKTLPKLERKVAQAEDSFNRTLRLLDMPIPKITPKLPIGLLAGAAMFLLLGSTVALMMYVDRQNGEPKKTRRRRKPKSRRASRPRQPVPVSAPVS